MHNSYKTELEINNIWGSSQENLLHTNTHRDKQSPYDQVKFYP